MLDTGLRVAEFSNFKRDNIDWQVLARNFDENSKRGAFLESFGNIPMSTNGNPAYSFDTGLTYQPRNNLQFDTSAGVGFSDNADDWFVGAGINFTFPF
ncbi:MAG: hypothetical protein D8M57_10360 [Candidatus Scalindua sp. AMX11]|nr:MAG: hypothetical protein DWQ00_01495 [Candidatus Scalindua sp.]TDE64991.1 MAG: hypothetical protein D8M57_10360 [Candidatus Scalindua sp. AMX11]